MKTIHPYIKKKLQEEKEYQEIIFPAVKKISEYFYLIKERFEKWQKETPEIEIPFKKWESGKTHIGIGLSGNDAYDYSGQLVSFRLSDSERVLNSLLSEVYTGEKRASFVPHSGIFYLSYLDSIVEMFAFGELAKYCPFPYYLNEEFTEENEKAFDWEFFQEYLISKFLEDVTFRDVVEINQ